MSKASEPQSQHGNWFATTHWNLVLAAASTSDPSSRSAMESLCRAYWYPLYAFVRRQGNDPHQAKDLTQAFFERFLEREFFRGVDRSKGRFRSFLLACLRHFLADERDRMRALKRGAGQALVPLDDAVAEGRYVAIADTALQPDQVYEREWLYAVLDRARERLRGEYAATGKGSLFDCLSCQRGTAEAGLTYAELGYRLGKTEKAIRLEAYRLRQRYHQLVREEIAQTVSDPAELEEEIRYLLGVIRG